MTRSVAPRRRGFTLVEMLVVMAIIAVLAAILLPAINAARRAARNNRIAQELNQLAQAVEAYKQKYGDYPPDFADVNAVARHMRKAFPRHTEGSTNTGMTRPDGTDAKVGASWADVSKLDRSEALVFWLGMVKKDARLPLNGSGKLDPMFPFKEDRLRDRDSDGWYEYYPQDGKDAPYVYFVARDGTSPADGILDYDNNNFTFSGTLILYPYKTNTGPSGATQWANKTTFQIISAGIDGDFGTANVDKVFPVGTNYSRGDMDNISNFSDGKTFEDHME